MIWAYLAAWTVGAPIVFPPESRMWSSTGLFFLLCVGFWELRTGSVTNPAYWVKDYFVDEISQRKNRKAPFDRMIIMGLIDILAHMTGFWLFLKTLDTMGETAAISIIAQPPNFPNCGWTWAFLTEVIVTSGTQLAATFPESLGITGRLGNLVGSFIGVYIFMIWGMSYTGAVMNPASALASTVLSPRFSKTAKYSLLSFFRTMIVYQIAPILGGVLSGIVEGGIERDRIKREKFE